MIICPSCHHKEIPGALFCSQCGAQLVLISPFDLPKDPMNKNVSNPKQNISSSPIPPAWTGDVRISLHLVESGQILPLADRTEFSLGRVAEGQPIMPDVDLTPFKAYENGVSRLHALLRLAEKEVVIIDLGSSNGTYVNGSRIAPNVKHPLRHGDMILLGKLKIQILFSPDYE